MTPTDPIASDRRALLALADRWLKEGKVSDAWNVAGEAAVYRQCAAELRAEIDRLQNAAKGGKE